MNRWNVNNDNVCIDGFDCVSICNGKPQMGTSDCCCTYEGCTFCFCNDSNKSTFESNPSQYTPQYGGFCAWNVSQGKCCTVDPNCWICEDGNLYLFANDEAKSNWQANMKACCATADANWSKGTLAAA